MSVTVIRGGLFLQLCVLPIFDDLCHLNSLLSGVGFKSETESALVVIGSQPMKPCLSSSQSSKSSLQQWLAQTFSVLLSIKLPSSYSVRLYSKSICTGRHSPHPLSQHQLCRSVVEGSWLIVFLRSIITSNPALKSDALRAPFSFALCTVGFRSALNFRDARDAQALIRKVAVDIPVFDCHFCPPFGFHSMSHCCRNSAQVTLPFISSGNSHFNLHINYVALSVQEHP